MNPIKLDIIIIGVYTPIMSAKDTGSKNSSQKELTPGQVSEGRMCTGFNLKRATRLVQSMFDDAFRPVGLEGTQYTVLSHIFVLGPITLSKLAGIMDVDRTTLARNLGPLEKRGLVEIKTGADRRARLINLTASGKEVLSAAYPIWKDTQNKIKKALGLDNWESMMSNLGGLVENLKER